MVEAMTILSIYFAVFLNGVFTGLGVFFAQKIGNSKLAKIVLREKALDERIKELEEKIKLIEK